MSAYLQYTLYPASVPDPNEPDEAATIATLDLRGFKTLKLDPESWDIVTPFVLLSGADAIVQRIVIRLRMFLAEWFLDKRVGVPYIERIFVVNVSARTLRRIFSKVIETVPGVVKVETMSVAFDKQTRRATISDFVVTLSDGSQITSKPEAPFII
jgi:hypothetical protein